MLFSRVPTTGEIHSYHIEHGRQQKKRNNHQTHTHQHTQGSTESLLARQLDAKMHISEVPRMGQEQPGVTQGVSSPLITQQYGKWNPQMAVLKKFLQEDFFNGQVRMKSTNSCSSTSRI
ncbi:hypothetical protein PROFUN_01128 [Planoprotostelium fungivorum]|uniref:Uncharacterized protein n=1 Tax=Planoprotostelium fungivorum TaxID=1890364 RepID=A0A2P6NCC9_9EUKA|nr:hypothetical protein PROFUN_01128 [Planoprotostelium fungivorum]